MEELKNRYPDEYVVLGNIIKGYNNLKENNIAGAYDLMKISLQYYYRFSVIKEEVKRGLKRGEKAELKELLESICKYLLETHTDCRIVYKNGRDDRRANIDLEV